MVARELTYLDFDVLLERAEQGTYRARVVNAPAGQTPSVAFTVPVTPLELENFVLRIGRPRRVVRRVDAPETAAIKTFGGQLYRALFHDQLEVNLLRSLSEAAAKGAGLRIRLRLSDTPELAQLPWEFLYDQTRNRFLALSDRTPLVRFLEVPDPPRPLLVTPPLQVLVMIASPSEYPQLDVEQEWTKLRTALGPLERAGQVQITRLEVATLSALRQQLRRADWHVLHFIGHGGFDPQTQDGVLVFEDQTGRSRLVSGQDLGVLLHDHNPLRLVVLNACEGARADPSDPFAGAAQSLIQQGIPAVVAMQFEITDSAAITFAQELYEAVADSYPLDAALTEARKAIYAEDNQIEWATPVLHLRAPDGRIFDMAPAPAAVDQPSIVPVIASTPKIAPPPPQEVLEPQPQPEPTTATIPPPALSDSSRSSTQAHAVQHPSKWGLTGSKAVFDVAFSPDGRWLATASEDKTARIWDARSGQQQQALSHDNWVRAVAFSPDGHWLATGSDDKTVRIWDAQIGQQRRTLRHGARMHAVAFSPDGRWLATGSADGRARIWDARSDHQHDAFRHGAPVYGVAFSPDGRWLASSGANGRARIWKVDSGRQQHNVRHDSSVWAVVLGPDDSSVWAVAFSPDGRWLATASTDKTARIWDARSGQQLHTLRHGNWVRAVAFSPDGRWLATGSDDKTVGIWKVHNGEQQRILRPGNRVWAVAFSPDGLWLAAGTEGNRAVLWMLEQSSQQ